MRQGDENELGFETEIFPADTGGSGPGATDVTAGGAQVTASGDNVQAT